MSDNEIAEIITSINEAGWNVANISQTDEGLWVVELRHHTSYGNVILTERENGMLHALRIAESKVAAIAELRMKARKLGLAPGKFAL